MFDLAAMDNLICAAFIGLLCLILFLNIFGLPANWIIVGLVVLWNMAAPQNFTILFWILFIGLALLGEVLEFYLQLYQGKRYGSSTAGGFAGMAGAFIGAILLAPVFWGLGAIIGALAGAWAGCLLMELCKGKTRQEALHSAYGTMIGRMLGAISKMGAGGAMIYLVARSISIFHQGNPALEEIPALPGSVAMAQLETLSGLAQACWPI